MAYTDINGEDRLVQQTFADHLETQLGWESLYGWNDETSWPDGTQGRASTRDVVLTRHLREAVERLNPGLRSSALDEAVATLTRVEFSRPLLQHNRTFYACILDGVLVSHREAAGRVYQHVWQRDVGREPMVS